MLAGQVDLHAHVLPSLDDGPGSEDAAFTLAEAALGAGTREIVATPHVDERRFVAPLELDGIVAAFNRRLAAVGLDLRVHPGAEIALTRLIDLTDAELEHLVLGGGPYLLLEAPLGSSANAVDFETLIHSARTRGFEVLLAHPERSPAFQRAPERLERLVASGVLVQITTGSILGDFGEHVRGFTQRLLREDLVHVLASDAHDATRRPPGLERAAQRMVEDTPSLATRVDWLTRQVPKAILAGQPVPPVDPLPEPRFARRLRLPVAGRGR